MRPDHPSHNPFFNRFHDPVHRRHADSQPPTLTDSDERNSAPEYARDRFGGLFALLALAVSFVVLLRVL